MLGEAGARSRTRGPGRLLHARCTAVCPAQHARWRRTQSMLSAQRGRTTQSGTAPRRRGRRTAGCCAGAPCVVCNRRHGAGEGVPRWVHGNTAATGAPHAPGRCCAAMQGSQAGLAVRPVPLHQAFSTPLLHAQLLAAGACRQGRTSSWTRSAPSTSRSNRGAAWSAGRTVWGGGQGGGKRTPYSKSVPQVGSQRRRPPSSRTKAAQDVCAIAERDDGQEVGHRAAACLWRRQGRTCDGWAVGRSAGERGAWRSARTPRATAIAVRHRFDAPHRWLPPRSRASALGAGTVVAVAPGSARAAGTRRLPSSVLATGRSPLLVAGRAEVERARSSQRQPTLAGLLPCV